MTAHGTLLDTFSFPLSYCLFGLGMTQYSYLFRLKLNILHNAGVDDHPHWTPGESAAWRSPWLQLSSGQQPARIFIQVQGISNGKYSVKYTFGTKSMGTGK